MKKFKEKIIKLVFVCLAALMIISLVMSHAMVEAVTVGGEVFLQGNYVEVGIHQSGSFGTQNNAPVGFHPTNGQLGFVVDPGKDGWTVGTPPKGGDFFVPGSPEEGWSVEWNAASGERTFGNYGLMGWFQIPKTSLTETTSGDERAAVWEGTATFGSNEKLKITKTIHFNKNEQFFVISTVMTNVGTTTLNSLEFMRNVDPDQEQPLTGNFTTRNYVNNDGNKKLVVGKGLNYGLTLGLGTIDSRAVVSTEGFSNRNPDDILNSPVTPSQSSPIVADQAIALAYRFGNLAPGQSVNFDYAYILHESDLERALGNLAAVTILQPTGTVSGSNVLFQATTDRLASTSQIAFYINGNLVGIDSTPDAGGVFEVTFDSLAYPNGTINLKAIATFLDGSTVEKTSTASVDNSGPPISFVTPTGGQVFVPGTTIPVSIAIGNPAQPPVRVSFFRETASSGSLFLGEDTSTPFESSFNVTGLPENETVIIKAVAYDSANRSTTIQVSGVTNTKQNQTINFPVITDKIYGDAPFAINATASSGLPVNLQVVSGPATLAGNILTITGTGSVTIEAAQPGNVNYNAAQVVLQTFNVAKATPVITWNKPANITYGTALSATQLNAISSVQGSFNYIPAAGTVLPAGNNQKLQMNFRPDDTANYHSVSSEVLINVQKAGMTIKAENKSRIYGTTNPPLTYIIEGFVNGDTQASASTGQPVLTTTANSTSPVGIYPITVSIDNFVAPNYNVHTLLYATLSVTKADQTINFAPLTNKTYGDADFQISATASSSLGVSFAASGKCTVAGDSVHITGAGSCTITASQAGNTNYNAAPNVAQTFNIVKATPVITWNNPSDIPYGTILSSTQLNALASVPGSFTYSPASGTKLNAGNGQTLSVNFTPTDTVNFNSVTRSVQINVLKATPSITVTGGQFTADGNPHSATGFAYGIGGESDVLEPAVTFSYLNLGDNTFSTNAPVSPGIYKVSAAFAGNSNYNSGYRIRRS